MLNTAVAIPIHRESTTLLTDNIVVVPPILADAIVYCLWPSRKGMVKVGEGSALLIILINSLFLPQEGRPIKTQMNLMTISIDHTPSLSDHTHTHRVT